MRTVTKGLDVRLANRPHLVFDFRHFGAQPLLTYLLIFRYGDCVRYDTIRYDTIQYINVRSIADEMASLI